MNQTSYINFLKKAKFNPTKAKQYQKAYQKIKETDLFDEKFYLEQYHNVAKSNIDPLIHYLFYGGNEGKYPSLKFNGNQYQNTYKEALNTNPLVHYILKGQYENHETFPVNYNQQYETILKNNLLYLHNYTFTEEPLVSIIILNRNGYHHLKRLFKDFKKNTNYNNYEIIIVDNASTDQSVEYLNSLDLPIKIIQNSQNESFSHGNNQAVQIAKGELILLLNNDIQPTYGWLNEMVGTITENENTAAVGAKLIYPYYFDRVSINKSFTIQHTKVKFEEVITNDYEYGPIHEDIEEKDIFNKKYNQKEQVLAVTAACVLIKKSVYEELGGLDEEYFYGYEDVDFMLKLHEKNYNVMCAGGALLFHHESSTRNDEGKFIEQNIKNIKTLTRKWEEYLFKNILLDKIKKLNFFTNYKLTIGILNTKPSNTNNETIKNLAKEVNNNDYNIELITDEKTRITSKETDILIIFDSTFDMSKLKTRKHTIKILYTEDKIPENIEDYNIILTKNNENNNEGNVFLIENLNLDCILDTVTKFYNIQ